ncbi:MAG: TolC family protein [Clostridium sp.]|nr:TolC family protein [Clostridium sp.]
MKHLLPALLAPLLLTGLRAGAQTVWSYADCVDYARENNISLQKSRLSVESSLIDLEEAKAQWQPTLDFATTQGFTNTPWSNGNKNVYNSSYGLDAAWTVWNGGQRENQIRRNRLQTRIDSLTTRNMVRTLETDLLQVYLNILYAREAIGIYEEAARLSEAQAERTRQLMEAGRVSRVEYAQLKSQYEQDRYAVVNARGTYDSRRMELKQLLELGIDSDILLQQLEWTEQQVLAPLPPIDESYTLAVDTDLELRSLELEKEGSDIDIRLARASGLPGISLRAGVGTGYMSGTGESFTSSLKQSWNESLGLTLSVPIFNQRKTSSAVARAKIQRLNAELDINQRLTELSQQVENWYIDTRSSQARYEAAVQQVASAELSAELTNEQFNLGLVNPVELMTAHNNLVEARYSLLQAKYMAMLGQKMIEYYRTAKITLP